MRRIVANDPGRASDSTSARVPRKQIQDNPRKTKENQGKLLGFPWIPLVELGLFNGLRREK
jgi:hypothetical protein